MEEFWKQIKLLLWHIDEGSFIKSMQAVHVLAIPYVIVMLCDKKYLAYLNIKTWF